MFIAFHHYSIGQYGIQKNIYIISLTRTHKNSCSHSSYRYEIMPIPGTRCLSSANVWKFKVRLTNPTRHLIYHWKRHDRRWDNATNTCNQHTAVRWTTDTLQSRFSSETDREKLRKLCSIETHVQHATN